MEQGNSPLSQETPFQRTMKWLILAGICVAFSGYFGWIFYHIMFVKDHWIVTRMQEQFAVTVSLPFAAVVALFVVLLLQFSSGPIEFEALGFKFKGAAGPIVLWVLCLLALVAAIKVLWHGA